MKSIITFGLALVGTFAAKASNNPGSHQSDSENGLGSGTSLHAKFVNEDFVSHPSTFIISGFIKSTDDVVSDNNQITDDAQVEQQPLFFETSVGEIRENNRVTDAKLPVYAPLDFKYIDKKVEMKIPAALPGL